MSEHVTSPKVYFLTFAALMVLLVVTVAAARLELGWASIVVAMTIASVKALLVALYFMHLRSSSRMVLVFAGAALLWLIILIGLTMSDYATR